jgi:hypothetical protein
MIFCEDDAFGVISIPEDRKVEGFTGEPVVRPAMWFMKMTASIVEATRPLIDP